jgi:GPI ethanolamine phosphate transferase 3 subunit O
MGYFNYLFVLVTFAFIVSTGIHIFSRGFLLTRSAQTDKRVCDKFLITFDGKQCLSNDKVNSDVMHAITTR